MHAQLADCGLAHELEGGSHVSLNHVMGTTGFIDPLFNDTQRVSRETDGVLTRTARAAFAACGAHTVSPMR
jgi:hypothetical protein